MHNWVSPLLCKAAVLKAAALLMPITVVACGREPLPQNGTHGRGGGAGTGASASAHVRSSPTDASARAGGDTPDAGLPVIARDARRCMIRLVKRRVLCGPPLQRPDAIRKPRHVVGPTALSMLCRDFDLGPTIDRHLPGTRRRRSNGQHYLLVLTERHRHDCA